MNKEKQCPCQSRKKHRPEEERTALMRTLEQQMLAAAGELEFEKAAQLRDQLLALRGEKAPVNDVQQKRRRRQRR